MRLFLPHRLFGVVVRQWMDHMNTDIVATCRHITAQLYLVPGTYTNEILAIQANSRSDHYLYTVLLMLGATGTYCATLRRP